MIDLGVGKFETLNDEIYIGTHKINEIWKGNKKIYPNETLQFGAYYRFKTNSSIYGPISNGGMYEVSLNDGLTIKDVYKAAFVVSYYKSFYVDHYDPSKGEYVFLWIEEVDLRYMVMSVPNNTQYYSTLPNSVINTKATYDDSVVFDYSGTYNVHERLCMKNNDPTFIYSTTNSSTRGIGTQSTNYGGPNDDDVVEFDSAFGWPSNKVKVFAYYEYERPNPLNNLINEANQWVQS